jgi:hypothetical protein
MNGEVVFACHAVIVQHIFAPRVSAHPSFLSTYCPSDVLVGLFLSDRNCTCQKRLCCLLRDSVSGQYYLLLCDMFSSHRRVGFP